MSKIFVTPDMLFPDAFEAWIARRTMSAPDNVSLVLKPVNARYLARRSIKDYRATAAALSKFFAKLTLGEIHQGHLTQYQSARAYCDVSACVEGAWEKPCGSNRIRKEMDLLVRILKSAKLWGDEQKEDFVRVRREDNDVRRALTPEEQDHFLRTAASREDWHFILWYACVGLQTAASTDELRNLQIGDVSVGRPGYEMIHIRWKSEGVKNKYRVRPVALEGQAIWAMEKLLDRAAKLGANQYHQYLFPLGARGGHSYDPNQPMSDSGLKKRWEAVRAAANLPWLRPYDLRHTGITRMAEAGVPVQVAMSIVGHMTLQQHRNYMDVSGNSQRRWMSAVWGGNPDQGGADAGKKQPSAVRPANQTGNGFAQKLPRRA
jgi:integrase